MHADTKAVIRAITIVDRAPADPIRFHQYPFPPVQAGGDWKATTFSKVLKLRAFFIIIM